ncbi:MAG: formyltetrahydrofolate deformylase [Balneolaceae bacterium]|nr:formyltetrahydrofolate deformylase [Balneolaceae bacterium]MBO6545641.1 formyltetrahydrofolate deformylase [Balneolaceae bacterium]MBO6647037.1 formyltetrahydrofolate deformylase [Balneolaceae bacterium]
MSRIKEAILLIHCKDKPGIIAAVTEYILNHGGNILDLDQHTDSVKQKFYMRVSWDLEKFDIPQEEMDTHFKQEIASSFKMSWSLHFSGKRQKLAIFVSKQQHCLFDILARWQTKEWDVDIPVIISNHEDAGETAEKFGIEFYHFPITKEIKKDQEAKQILLLKEKGIDIIVLARYMQILSHGFIDVFRNQVINIHHSFLPAFPGARPYHSAYERGVKIIGATSHYVTEDLDEGPIIEQDIVHVTHRDDIESLVRKGRDLETLVLSRAVWKHIRRKTLVTDNRTIIFN